MKKLIFSVLCGVLLMGSVDYARADWRSSLQKVGIGAGVVIGTIALGSCVWIGDEVFKYADARSKFLFAKKRSPETIELLEKIDLMTFDCSDAASELLLRHSANEYTCLEAITSLDRVIADLTPVSRSFRNSEGFLFSKFYLLKKVSFEQKERADALIKNANDIAGIIKGNPQYIWEVSEIDRRQKEARQHQINLINANQPKNQVQVKQVY